MLPLVLGNNRKISHIEILIFISYREINPLYYRHGCNSTKWSINLFFFITIIGDEEIKKISQNFFNYKRMQVILPHIDYIVIHIVIVVFSLLSIVLWWFYYRPALATIPINHVKGKSTKTSANSKPCYRCEKANHAPPQCRFKNAICYKSQKKGHIAPVCQSKKPLVSDKKPSSKQQDNWMVHQTVMMISQLQGVTITK